MNNVGISRALQSTPDQPESVVAASPAKFKRVLLISNKVFHYRMSNYNYFARRFREEGYEFFVRASELEARNPFSPDFDFKVMAFDFANYRREIEEIKPDVVIIFLFLKDPFTWRVAQWVKSRGVPLVYWNKGINMEVKRPWLRNWVFHLIHNISDGIILYTVNEVPHIRPKNRHKVHVASNTINFASFPEITESKQQIKDSLGIPFEKVVLFVGRMRPVKKVDHLIEAFNSIRDPGIGCVIVGDAMGKDIEGMSHHGNVRYLGEVHDPSNLQISRIFKMADVFCIPGDLGLGLNQAFYWGLPVVSEMGLQPPEICYLTAGETGFLVTENDLQDLTAKILLLTRDDALRARFSKKAMEDIRKDASIERMFSGFRDCVRQLTASRHGESSR